MQRSTAISAAKAVRYLALAGCASGIMMAGRAMAYDFAPPPPGVPGNEFNVFKLYVADQVTYDDNLFRLPPGTPGVPGAVYPNSHQSDVVNSTTLGGQGKWEIARQEIDLDIRADEVRFKDNDDLNFVAANAVGTWNWRLGQYLSGQVATFYDRSLTSFSQTRFTGKDIVTSLEELGYGRYQIGPHWAAYGQVRGSYTDHSAEINRFNDFHNKAGYAGVEYATDVNDTFGFEYQYVDITFDQSTTPGIPIYDYDEDSGRFQGKYSLSDKTALSGYAGYLQRKYPGLAIGAYSGEIWRFGVEYSPTDKTQLAFSVWHELHAYVDAESNYFVAKGVSLAPIWSPTEKVSLTVMGSYEDQNYIPTANTVIVAGARQDKVESGQATVRYYPRANWIVDIFIRHEKRESNQYQFSFNDNIASGSVTYRFW